MIATTGIACPPFARWLAIVVALIWTLCVNAAIAQDRAVLDISKYTTTFSEDFDDLAVSAWGPIAPGKARWIAHTPTATDFGDAAFADPEPGFPFTIDKGILRIEARKGADGRWRSGLLSSSDGKHNGFHQQFGYFEMRAKLPPGPGLWPAFWLLNNQHPDFSAEIDVLEHYGSFPDVYESVTHVWAKNDKAKNSGDLKKNHVPAGSLYNDFHTYGVSVDKDWIIFFHDRVEVSRIASSPEFHQPMFILLNLAMGSGWPIDQTPNPSYMYVDYVRAYAKK